LLHERRLDRRMVNRMLWGCGRGHSSVECTSTHRMHRVGDTTLDPTPSLIMRASPCHSTRRNYACMTIVCMDGHTRACARAARSPPTRPLTSRSHQMHKLSCPHPLNLDSTSSSSHILSHRVAQVSVLTLKAELFVWQRCRKTTHTLPMTRATTNQPQRSQQSVARRARAHICDELEERGEKNALMRPGAARKHRATRAGQVTFFVFAMSFTPDAVIKAACKPSSHLCWERATCPAASGCECYFICLLRCVMCEKKKHVRCGNEVGAWARELGNESCTHASE
jgi:hypothetical protein